jgi:hypothetical protein
VFDAMPDAVDTGEECCARSDDVRFAFQAIGTAEPEGDVVGEKLRQRVDITAIDGVEQGPDQAFE